jgi:hypothetical protein
MWPRPSRRAPGRGRFTWEDYGGVHPNAFGYELASELIIKALPGRQEGLAPGRTRPLKTLPPPLDPGSYSAGILVDPQIAQSDARWTYGPVSRELLPKGTIRADYLHQPVLRGDAVGAMLEFAFTGRAVGASVLAGPDAGVVDIQVDGSPWKPVDLYHHYSAHLNYPRTLRFRRGPPSRAPYPQASDLQPPCSLQRRALRFHPELCGPQGVVLPRTGFEGCSDVEPQVSAPTGAAKTFRASPRFKTPLPSREREDSSSAANGLFHNLRILLNFKRNRSNLAAIMVRPTETVFGAGSLFTPI